MNATDDLINCCWFRVAWGHIVLIYQDDVITRLHMLFHGQDPAVFIDNHYPSAVENNDGMKRVQNDLICYFDGEQVNFDCWVATRHQSEFARRILEACSRIAYGQTRSYTELARLAGRPGAARAAGRVMAGNAIPIIIPCHRVIRSDGKLGGYTADGGLELKLKLLSSEASGLLGLT